MALKILQDRVKSTVRGSIAALGLAAASVAPYGVAVATPAGNAQDFDPVAAYDGRIAFDVLRNGTPVGSHLVTFEKDGRELVASSHMRLSVEMLFITLYRLDYRSVSRWRNNRMAGLQVTVDENGSPFSLSADALSDGNALRVQAGEDSYVARQPVYPTDHWNPGVLTERRVLNTLTGRINEVRIEQRGRELVPTERGPVDATHFAYTGELTTEVWYDDFGRWVRMRFKGSDGSTIEYRCRRCQGDTATEAGDAR